jgi:hypothetical protein
MGGIEAPGGGGTSVLCLLPHHYQDQPDTLVQSSQASVN